MEDPEKVAHFLTSHVLPTYEHLQEEANSQAGVEFFDFCGKDSMDKMFSAFFYTYLQNPDSSKRNPMELLKQVETQFPKERQLLRNLKNLQGKVQYDPLQRVHKIAIYLTFLAFIHPQYTGSNVLNHFLSWLLILD